METLTPVFGVLAAIILFLYGLQGFSREVEAHGRKTLQAWFGRVTRNRIFGFLLGAGATAVVQSSSAVTSIAVALVGAGVIGFRQSLPVLFGANLGTTVTAWLVAFKLTGLGPFFLVLGGILSILPGRIQVLGKSLFYFGFIFFSLGLISDSLAPLRESPLFMHWLQWIEHPVAGVLAGMAITLLVQSSSVTTGLLIVLVQQGMMTAEVAIAVVIGANLGSTGTALLASIPLSHEARRAAVANLLFNVGGLLLWIPFIPLLADAVMEATASPAMAVALAHVLFNLSTALVFLALLKPFAAGMDRLLPPKQAAMA
jgi:Na/Pi-cotransporter